VPGDVECIGEYGLEADTHLLERLRADNMLWPDEWTEMMTAKPPQIWELFQAMVDGFQGSLEAHDTGKRWVPILVAPRPGRKIPTLYIVKSDSAEAAQLGSILDNYRGYMHLMRKADEESPEVAEAA